MGKKRKFLPYWMRRRISCPDCGHIYKEQNYDYSLTAKECFSCPKCGLRLTDFEFWEENNFKWSREADLSLEELEIDKK